ncbi:MAG: bifunctional glutamate N-acetyltransferase/amino-acid acetyltransferase ArgJ [Raoultibacter sp.]
MADENSTAACTLEVVEGGGVTSAVGFTAAGMHAGLRRDPTRFDLALVCADQLCTCAATFTTNVFCAAPVLVSREHLNDTGEGVARAVIINSGNANAATGTQGLSAARAVCSYTADALGCAAEDVLVASTGVIGVHLPLEPFAAAAVPLARAASRAGGDAAAHAIMTTDTFPKQCALSYISRDPACAGMRVSVGGMVKGSGMIMPNMATMIAVITTDAPLAQAQAHAALRTAVGASFNKVTVDSDTSTNDTCILMASGEAPGAPAGWVIEEGSPAAAEFAAALNEVCVTLARQIATDGEGATRLITVSVAGAQNDADADAAARAVANSPLVKTAIFGHDANWGRIAAALGKSGAAFSQHNVDIDIMGIAVCRGGLTCAFDEEEALRRFENPEITLAINLGQGNAHTTVWTCDFSHEYISINGDYRS